MDWIDYRKKLGIGFSDVQKFEFFNAKIFNISCLVETVTATEYYQFCNVTGNEIDTRLFEDYRGADRLAVIKNIIWTKGKTLECFLAYYVAFLNVKKDSELINWTKTMLNESQIPFDIINDDDGMFIFPKGAKELDDALVSQILDWLSEYPQARTAWVKALKEYSNQTDDNASDIADKFRKALETFFQEFFDGDHSLENYKSAYGAYLNEKGVPTELSNNFQKLLESYTLYINNYAKHHDKTSKNILEYILYQTGNIIRLLINLKHEEQNNN